MKKVFICWSGIRAKHVAQGLYRWLPDVLQNVDPWMSAESVAAGARFNREVEQRLATTDFGILCITPENTGAPWIHYEAGALGKHVDVGRVVPYLIGMRTVAELPEGPLTRFQAKVALTESLEVLKSLNEAMGPEGLPEDRLERSFQRCWPDLEEILKTLPPLEAAIRAPDTTVMIAEILETVRDLARERQSSLSPPHTFYGEVFCESVRETMNADPRTDRLGVVVRGVEELGANRFRIHYAAADGTNDESVVAKLSAAPMDRATALQRVRNTGLAYIGIRLRRALRKTDDDAAADAPEEHKQTE